MIELETVDCCASCVHVYMDYDDVNFCMKLSGFEQPYTWTMYSRLTYFKHVMVNQFNKCGHFERCKNI